MTELDKAVTEYLEVYEKVRDIEEQLKSAREKLAGQRAFLISVMQGNGITRLGRGSQTVAWTKRSWAKVKDYAKLREWVDKQDCPAEEYMEQVFRADVLNELARVAQYNALKNKGKLEDYLPDGLDIATTDVITVRDTGKKKDNGLDDELDSILEGK